MRVGIDSYSYHRMLGDLRPGESAPPARLSDGGAAVLAEVRELGVDGVSLETCYLPPPTSALGRDLAAAARPLELAFSWGAPNGLAFGASQTALDDLLAWIDAAGSAGTTMMRIVVAGPTLRGLEPVDEQIHRTVEPLRVAAAAAAAQGVGLAVENHGDLTASQLDMLLDRVGSDVGVCFDTANALRVGDDTLEATRLLGPRVRMLHLKDVEPVTEDTDFVAGPKSVRYGRGVVPLEEVLDIVSGCGFSGLACIEIAQLGSGDDERELIADSVTWLRDRVAA